MKHEKGLTCLLYLTTATMNQSEKRKKIISTHQEKGGNARDISLIVGSNPTPRTEVGALVFV